MTRIVLFILVFALACVQGPPAAAAGRLQAPAPAVDAAKPVSAELPDVVANVNGHAIGKSELESAVAQLEARAGQPVPVAQRDQIFRGVLDQLIAYRLLAQESVARKAEVPDADIDARVAEIQSQYPSEQAFQQTLDQRKTTLPGLRANLREGMQIDKMLDTALPNGGVTADQVNEFYTKNPSEFQQAGRVRASHILIGVPAGADAAAKEQARTKAAEVLKDVKAGKDFAALAAEHSQDPGSGPKGGDLGYFERGQMVGPFEQAAFALAAEQISDLVETQFGYHIIKVIDAQAARTIPVDEVRPQIEQYLQGQNRDRETDAFIETLKAKSKIDIFI